MTKLLSSLRELVTSDPERLCGGRDRAYSNFSSIMRCSHTLLHSYEGHTEKVTLDPPSPYSFPL